MIPDALPLVRIADPKQRFDRCRTLMNQWHLARTRERLAKVTVGIIEGDDETDDVLTTPLTTKEIELLDGLARQTRAVEMVFLGEAESYFMLGRGGW